MKIKLLKSVSFCGRHYKAGNKIEVQILREIDSGILVKTPKSPNKFLFNDEFKLLTH